MNGNTMEQMTLFEDVVLKATDKCGQTSGTYDYFADEIGLTAQQLDELTFAGKGGYISKWKRKIRFIQQSLKLKGLISRGDELGQWYVTIKGKSHLTKIVRGSARVYFVTKQGIAIWGYAQDVGKLFKNEVSLIITSPPYLLTKDRQYGNIGTTQVDYVANLLELAASWIDMLTPDGSIVLNIGPSYKKGCGHQSLHVERLLIALEDQLGLHLVQKFAWWSPNKMPTGHHVTKTKKHCVNAMEDFLWLSPNPKIVKSDNQMVKVEYSDKQKKMIENQMSRKGAVSWRPSGNRVDDASFYADNGGAIPHNILISSPEGSNSAYSRHCKKSGLPRHPAMFSSDLPGFFIKFLTDEGDFVFDPFLGSATVGLAAENCNRFWGGCEVFRQYLEGAKFRFGL
jgi:site-specific DNA-methyltransferase (cytosine-N4-specific)